MALPLLCLWLIKDKKEALIKAIAFCCSVVFIASFIVPESEQLLLTRLEPIRYIAVVAVVILEALAILTVFYACKTAIEKGGDPDHSIDRSIIKLLGRNPIASLLTFETRMWAYALFQTRIKRENFSGKLHFSYHEKDGTKVDLLGVVCLIAFELPIAHLVLHFMWSPLAANIISGLTAFGLVFFYAEYRAVSIRPVSLSDENLLIRYGIWNALKIKRSDIEYVKLNKAQITRRSRSIKRYNYFGTPNIVIKLKNHRYDKVYLGLDSPNYFINAISDLPSYG